MSGRNRPEYAEEWGISKSAISQWAHLRVREGVLVWCDDDGNEFHDANELKKAKSTGKAFLRLNDGYAPVKSIGLPTPYDLTGDEEWKEGGAVWTRFDLELEARRGIKEHSGIKEVLRGGLNTPEKREPVEMSEKCEDEEEGIKVLSEIPVMNDENLKSDASGKGNGEAGKYFGVTLL
jgi:hypothetical protein